MAFATIVLRSARQAIPLASRAFTSQASHHTRSTATAAVISAVERTTLSLHFLRSTTDSSNRRHFCSSVASVDSSSGEKLLEVLQSEISVYEESGDVENAIEFPSRFPFKIEDNVGERIVTLTRENQSETITVEVYMTSILTGEEDEDEDEDEDDDEEDKEESRSASSVPLLVTLAPKKGPYLEFDCTAYPHKITINRLLLKNPDIEDELAYEGPDFLDLDEKLRKAFHKCLDIRGIKPSTINFLHEYMIEKDSKEYLSWLKDVQKFIEA